MAVLTDEARHAVWAAYMEEMLVTEAFSIQKADLRAAVNALDDWLNANAASANAALPPSARTALSTSQKARLLTQIVYRRYIEGS